MTMTWYAQTYVDTRLALLLTGFGMLSHASFEALATLQFVARLLRQVLNLDRMDPRCVDACEIAALQASVKFASVMQLTACVMS